ncbi:hypothetical protein NB550_21010 [Vibrio parahaemolyticus]|uniref:hypothetical protein n=1 Tax=Vibrio harveyi group TaxID=717610 RepID=UPI00215C9EFD|nr:hypothetical protein [Vibrio parahaemolyticus]EKH9208414.1 hypothetical protein [Vibrio parahaemolyticus]MCR9919969.1 hypothetical protein [Vibrio parahaemolyticus]
MKDKNNKEITFNQEDLKFINEKKEMTLDDLADGIQFESQEIKLKSKLPKAGISFKPRR